MRTPQQATWANIKLGLTMLRNIFWKVGVLGDYKWQFWKFALRRLARGQIEYLISSMLVAHHLIMFARDASTRPAERVELFDTAARGVGTGRIDQ